MPYYPARDKILYAKNMQDLTRKAQYDLNNGWQIKSGPKEVSNWEFIIVLHKPSHYTPSMSLGGF